MTRILGVESELLAPKAQTQAGQDYPPSSLQVIHDIKPRLAAGFRDLSDADLLVQGIFFVARKPGA